MPSFSIIEFFPGLGTLCSSLSSGLAQVGEVRVAGVVELDGRYLKLFSEQHPEASTILGSVTAYAPEETTAIASAKDISLFIAGVPCTGASLAGRSKNRLEAAEMHPDVGHLFLPTLHHIALHRPAIVVFENVPQYRTTYSADVIRSYLTRIGYNLAEFDLNPFTDFNTATERRRWVCVGTLASLGKFEWDYAPVRFSSTIEHLLDAVSVQDKEDQFSAEQVAAHTKYCARKAAEGCGFARRVLTRSSTKVPTIPKSYGKIQPTGVFTDSGCDAGTYRMLRPREIARIHGFDARFVAQIETLPKTTAYEVLGQGVVAAPFRALGAAIGQWVKSVDQRAHRVAT